MIIYVKLKPQSQKFAVSGMYECYLKKHINLFLVWMLSYCPMQYSIYDFCWMNENN